MGKFMQRRFFTRALLLASLALLATVGTLLQAQGPVHRIPITALAVAQILAQSGLVVDPRQIQLPASLTSSTELPTLRMDGAELLPDGRLRVRISCQQAGQCQSFLASVETHGTGDSLATLGAFDSNRARAGSTRSTSLSALQAGKPATLLMEDPHMRIQLPVIAIDSGAVGAAVRVSSLDRKQIFHGVVTREQTVKADLP